MSIRAKVLLLSFIVLSLLSVGLTVGVIYQIQQDFNAERANYRDKELAQVKDTLKNLVDIAYTTIEADYRSLSDKQVVEMRYGLRLQNVIDLAEAISRHYMEEVEKQTMSVEEAVRASISSGSTLLISWGRSIDFP